MCTFDACKSLEDFEILFPPRKVAAGAEITRVGPSPTGQPHIGTAMQAVLDRAIANKTDGIFILRIEDTDVARTVEGSFDAILSSLNWLGMIPDEAQNFGGDYGPYTQTKRLPLYNIAAKKLIDDGHAYYCFCTQERLDHIRSIQTAKHQSPRYDNHCRSLPKDEAMARVEQGEKHVIRMKIPEKETISFYDEVRGNISFEADVLDDAVLMKSDGIPTYHLASVVDDHFMRITLVVRGEEWISSAPKHMLLYRYFNWNPPRFLHTVLLRDKEKRKLGKRKGDTSLAWFRKQGILPQALCNFLCRIMWAHPEGKDIYTLDEFAEKLKLDGLPSTGPVADYDLLLFINVKYLHGIKTEECKAVFMDYLDYMIALDASAFSTMDPDDNAMEATPDDMRLLRDALKVDPDYADAVLALAVQRSQRLADLVFNCRFYFDYGYVPPSIEKMEAECPDPDIRRQILSRILKLLTHDSHASQLETFMKQIAKELGVKDRVVFMTIRLAMTGEEKTPPHSEVVSVLKLDRARARLNAVLDSIVG